MSQLDCPSNLVSPVFDAFCQSIDQQYIYLCDISTDVWRWSSHAVAFFGLPGELVANFSSLWMERVHPDDRSKIASAFEDLLQGRVQQHSCEYRVRNADEEYIWVLCRGCIVPQMPVGSNPVCVGVLTHLGQSNKFDSVTGLPSVHEFRRVLDGYITDPDLQYGILLLGVDNFRRLNESANYAFGNRVLARYATELLRLLPEQAQLFRMEGAKFAFVCKGYSTDCLQQLFDQAAAIARKEIELDGAHLPLAVSGGAALYPQNGVTTDELHTSIEYALDYSKKNNREGLTLFTEQLQRETAKQYRLEQKLIDSIEHNFAGFYLCYQPTVTADEQHGLVGAEALLRWFHPNFGFVSPAVLIPILEASGRIVPLGKWVFSTALRQFKEWMIHKPHIKVSINVSLIQFLDPSFRQYVLDEIAYCTFPKDHLILELTESCSVTQLDQVREELDFFRQHGIQIALDDFGTGYASLSVLRDLSADWVKVDHSFVAQIAENDFDQALTENLITLCKKLNLHVCVEGIETNEIASIIQGYQPTLLQGYLFSRPLDARQFEEKYIVS